MTDDSTINLRGNNDDDGDDAEFQIGSIEDERREQIIGNIEVVGVPEDDEIAGKHYGKVKVKFDKFVNLVASHAYEEVFDKHIDQDIILSTDLLTDLANAHEEKSDRKMPVVFLVGIVLGVALTWLLIKYS